VQTTASVTEVQTAAPHAEVQAEPVREVQQGIAETVSAPSAPAPQVEHAQPAAAPDSPPPLELEWPAGLMLVETDPQKAAAAAAQPQPEPPPRRPRVRKAPPPQSTEPLVQVETRHREPADIGQP
jgi:ribonuclease E